MRRILATVLVSAVCAWMVGPVQGQGAAPRSPARPGTPASPKGAPTNGQAVDPPRAVPPRAADPRVMTEKMENLLDLWEKHGATITTLDARFKREDVTKAWGTKEVFWGRAILKSPDFAFLNFEKDEGNNKPPAPYEQIRCTGKEVYHYRNANHQIFVYPLPAQKQERALQEGPLPFLFNVRAAEAKERYSMTLVDETPTLYVIQITPRTQTDQEAFVRADVLLDKQKFLPSAIKLWAPNGTDYQMYSFTTEGCYINTNVAVSEKNFERRLLNGWGVIRNPNAEGRPAPRGAARAARGGQAVPRR